MPKNQPFIDEETKFYSFNERVWNLIAPIYDIAVLPLSKVRDKVALIAGARKSLSILDVATGTGRQAFAFAKKGSEVIGIDVSDAMLRVATKNNILPNSNFGLADATNLPFEKNSFDVSCVSFALHDMPSAMRVKVLREMARVTKPNEKIIIVDYALPKNRIGRFLIYNIVKLYEDKNYRDFVRSDFSNVLEQARIEIEEEHTILLGAAKIFKGAVKLQQNANL